MCSGAWNGKENSAYNEKQKFDEERDKTVRAEGVG
jgi:hypothetical protein